MIGITTCITTCTTTDSRSAAGEFTLPAAYVEAVQRAGGAAVLLPPQPQPEALIAALDGVIFTGGGDISPDCYGGVQHPTVYGVDDVRDTFELKLAKYLLTSQIPTLGICRGMQILAVASGAELLPHLPEIYGEQVVHRLDQPRRPIPHLVQAVPESRLALLLAAAEFEAEFEIVSWHHQAIKALPDGWQIAATAADGLIEAMEYQPHPWMFAVQWHPELSPDDPVQQRLFRAFVSACKLKLESRI